MPERILGPVVAPGEFVFSAAHLDHGHIFSMCQALIQAGAVLKSVYEPDPNQLEAFLKAFPQAKPARSLDEILEDNRVSLVAAAAVPDKRYEVGLRTMEAGKDYFTDKTPFTQLAQVEAARVMAAKTGKKYMVYYGERLHSEAGIYAGQLIEGGAIGRVIQVLGMGPHRLRPETRPAWFYQKAHYGGILCDIGSHQIEQFLHYTGAQDATVTASRVANYAHPDTPELDDFGDASLVADNGATNYFRVDWFTPDGLSTWGDGRTFILGTK
nr:Gfo/Idh/MocA family oxidoreductase [bacterium]